MLDLDRRESRLLIRFLLILILAGRSFFLVLGRLGKPKSTSGLFSLEGLLLAAEAVFAFFAFFFGGIPAS